MTRQQFAKGLLATSVAALWPTFAVNAQSGPPIRRPDLADAAAGTYVGDVISDSKGSSKSDVTLTVTRIAKNVVRVTSDYPRLPTVDVALTSAMGKILQQRGNTVFLLDRTNARLDVSFMNEVSWAGTRR